MGPLHLHQLLPMVSHGPFTFSRGIANALGWAYHIGAANAPEWAHCNSCCCWPQHCSGPLFFWWMLPMPYGGPIALAGAPANGLTLAHYVSGRCCLWLCLGQFIFQEILPMP